MVGYVDHAGHNNPAARLRWSGVIGICKNVVVGRRAHSPAVEILFHVNRKSLILQHSVFDLIVVTVLNSRHALVTDHESLGVLWLALQLAGAEERAHYSVGLQVVFLESVDF